jgi:hypothetical protein
MSTSIASAVASSIKRKPDDAWLRRGQDIARRVSHQQWEIGVPRATAANLCIGWHECKRGRSTDAMV